MEPIHTIPASDVDKLLSKSEAAQLLRTSERHIQTLASNGLLGHCRIGRRLLFQQSDIQAYLDSTAVAPRGGHR